MRKLRFVPKPGVLVEVTTRTLHGRLFFRPGALLNDLVVGVLARGQRKYGIRCCGYFVASNHVHLLLDVDDALQMASYMRFVNSNLARKVGRLVGWREKIWSRRYQAIVISNDEEAMVARLRYILAHGIKENLVDKASEWPGLHCAPALITGLPVEGHWFDQTQEYAARRRGETFERMKYASLEILILSPLPCWQHLPEEVWRRRVAELVSEIESEAALRRQRTGSQVLGVAAIRGQHPHDRPKRSKRSPAPLFHAASQIVRRELYDAYRWFEAAFREASAKLRAGDRTVRFPAGSFPPALPFVAVAG